jgi:predicted permease
MHPRLLLPLRALRKSPGFTCTAVLLIALGIAASTTAFTLVHTLFFKPRAGVVRPAEIVNVHPAREDGSFGAWSYPDFQRTRAGLAQLAGLSAFTGLETGVAIGQRSFSAKTTLASANYFDVLGVPPALGRLFLPADEAQVGQSPVAVISHRLWQTEFNGAPDTIGRAIRVNGESLTIVGVAARGFHGTFVGFDMDLWVPLAMARIISAEGDLAQRDAHWLEVLGRLAPGATIASAQAELAARFAAIGADQPKASGDQNGDRVVVLPNTPIDDSLRGTALGFVGALATIAALVLVIACLNVGSLLLTRAEERRRESAVRVALGCNRRQLIAHWLTESLVLFALGGAAGLLLAMWIADLGLFRQPTPLVPLAFDFGLDLRAFGFCFALTLLAGLLAGLFPALRSAKTDVVNDLKAGGHGASSSSRLRFALVAAQLALAVVPLVAAGLFARTLDRAAAISPGWAADRLLIVPLNIGQLGDYRQHAPAASRALLDAARRTPGVESAAIGSRVPLGQGSLSTYLKANGTVAPLPESGLLVALTYADDAYFSTLGIPLVAGRSFRAGEKNNENAGVTVLNETLARQLFGSAHAALDRPVLQGKRQLTVIGVARDAQHSRLWEKPRAQFFLPLEGNPRPRLALAVRTSADPARVVSTLHEALRQAQPDLPLNPPVLGTDQIALTVFPQRLGARIAAVLGAVCLVLAAVGLYSVLALGAVREMREFGIRVALGAQRADLVTLIVRRVGWLVAVGGLAGGALAFGLAQLLGSFLHGVSKLDPLAYLGTVAVLAAAALIAAWLPARRAARVDPLIALRAE